MAVDFIIGRKIGMTRIFDDVGFDYPVTIVEAGPCEVTQIKSIDKEGYALYFSRESIPSRAKYTGQITMWKQLGLIVFRKKALLGYSRLEPTHLEKIESVDMNRLIENGKEIKMVSTNFETIGVDTELDLQEAKARLKKDPLVNEYLL